MTPEELLRQTTARLRAQAAALPAGEALGPETAPETADPADRPAADEPVREEVPPQQHWQEAAEARSDERQPPARGSR